MNNTPIQPSLIGIISNKEMFTQHIVNRLVQSVNGPLNLAERAKLALVNKSFYTQMNIHLTDQIHRLINSYRINNKKDPAYWNAEQGKCILNVVFFLDDFGITSKDTFVILQTLLAKNSHNNKWGFFCHIYMLFLIEKLDSCKLGSSIHKKTIESLWPKIFDVILHSNLQLDVLLSAVDSLGLKILIIKYCGTLVNKDPLKLNLNQLKLCTTQCLKCLSIHFRHFGPKNAPAKLLSKIINQGLLDNHPDLVETILKDKNSYIEDEDYLTANYLKVLIQLSNRGLLKNKHKHHEEIFELASKLLPFNGGVAEFAVVRSQELLTCMTSRGSFNKTSVHYEGIIQQIQKNLTVDDPLEDVHKTARQLLKAIEMHIK